MSPAGCYPFDRNGRGAPALPVTAGDRGLTQTTNTMCLYPRLITNPKYKPNKKNGGKVPPCDDKRKLLIPVGCQKCIECVKKKSREWRVRLLEELKLDEEREFLTLTISNEAYTELSKSVQGKTGYELDNAIAKLAVRRWLERCRAATKKSVKHWLITEIGGNGEERIHLHGIVFGTKARIVQRTWKHVVKDNSNLENIKKRWNYGHIWTGKYVNPKTVNYIIKYCAKADPKHPGYIPIILTSPGIGRGYEKSFNALQNAYKPNGTNETYRTPTGIKTALPIYYRNKIYSEEEREALWLEKLNKQERWVMGNKVSIANGDKEYYAVLNTARQKNARLGFQQPNWEKEEYDRQRREFLTEGKRRHPNDLDALQTETLDRDRKSNTDQEFEKITKWIRTAQA